MTGDAPIVPDEIPVGKMLVRQGQGGGGGGGKAGKGGKAGGGEEGGEVAANNATAVAKGIPVRKISQENTFCIAITIFFY